MVTFRDMVLGSQIIVEARPILIEDHKTTFEIQTFFQGGISDSRVTINRSHEVHDQKILFVGNHILFLTLDPKLGWTSASYGRSYWPLIPVVDIVGDHVKGCDYAVLLRGTLKKG